MWRRIWLRPFRAARWQTLSGIAYAPVAVVAARLLQAADRTPLGRLWGSDPAKRETIARSAPCGIRCFSRTRAGRQIVMTSFVGGATDPEMTEKPEEEIAAIVQKENARDSRHHGAPITSVVWKHPKALPQYNLGHGHTSRQSARRARNPGPVLCGQLSRRTVNREMR